MRIWIAAWMTAKTGWRLEIEYKQPEGGLLWGIKQPLKRRVLLPMAVSVLLVSTVLSGCGGPAASSAEEYEIGEDQKLVLYTSHQEEVYGPIVKEFEERTGIWVDVRAGGTTEMLEAVKAEAGLSTCDVMFGGGVESYEAYREYFEPYACSQSSLLDSKYRSPENMWTIFTELPIVFIYNSKLVSEEEAPVSWEEFLKERWTGQIAFADPRKSGTSYTALATMAQILRLDETEMMDQFVAVLDGKLSAGSGEVVREVSAGVRLVGITLEEAAKKEIAAGADIGMVYPVEGTSAVPDGCALVKGAPHEENAKLFIDFTVSDDVQDLAVDQFCRRSVRIDMQREQEDIEALGTLKIIDFDLKQAGERQEEVLKRWAELVD